MTPKEKAEELINKYLNASFNCKDCDMPYCDIKCTMLSKREAKVCALIAVDEIYESLKQTFHQVHKKTEMTYDMYLSESISVHYYQEVKREIEKL